MLYSNHACNEPDFDHPAGVNYYLSHGDGWGKGGRVYIYIMYEQGSIATGEDKVRCGHPNASDPTTLQEQADFAQYTTDQRIKIAKDIFGDNVFGAGNGETTEGTTSAGGIQVATVTTSSGKTYKRFKQGTGPWAGMGYAGGTMSHSGCNMTCVAIVLSAYGFNDVTPANYAGAMKSADVEIQKKLPGTKLRIRTKGVEKSAYANVQPQHKEDIMNHLVTGNPVVFHVLSGSKYTNSQHWMVLVDISGEQVYLIDPGSSKRDGWVDINEVLRYMCCYTKVAP